MKILETRKSILFRRIALGTDLKRRTSLRLIVTSCEVSQNDSNLDKIHIPIEAKRTIHKAIRKASRMRTVLTRKAYTKNSKH